ncbi:TRAP transporter small permease [Hoyosella sp. YIM 151337]|uniref:TRAP transporter small permease n=1 Tax=Hoyosella sp. YIM 151337 TaxID=2992742 RepID=UPI002236069A|nr:TRAP transporter small permease [Hoyosella sp. YIM 151337]MCW4355684.1 TRAP transporter small permease [Hoyosella sp. YIM 151337]
MTALSASRRPRNVVGALRVATLAVAATGLIIMMLHIVLNAALRTFVNAPVTGTNEIVSYWYMPLVALCGFVLAQRDRAHTEARVLFNRLPARLQRETHCAGLLLVAIACAGFAYFGFREALHSQHLGLTGGVTGVVIWPVTFLVPLIFAAITVQVLAEAVSTARGSRSC